MYQLLSRRIQRDLLLASAVLASHGNPKGLSAAVKHKPLDMRLYPAVVKLLDTVVQSLDQMRTLSIVDDNPDLAHAVEARLTFTKARRYVVCPRCRSLLT